MYKISDFSKITKLTVKALRYYDEENILNPSFRHEEKKNMIEQKIISEKETIRKIDLYIKPVAEFKEQADIELCVPTTKLISAATIDSKILPAIKAICTTHTGNYESINLAYKALLDYATSQNLKCLTPSREVYIKGPGMIFKGNPNKYVTEIILPFESEV